MSTIATANSIKQDYKITSYIEIRNKDFAQARKLYKQTHQVEFSTTDHWVKVGGIVINGISRKDMERIIKEIETEMENENNHDNI